MDDDELFSVDPFDLLQEHDLEIHRIKKRLLRIEKYLQEISENQAALSEFLVKTNQRMDNLENEIVNTTANNRPRR